MEHTQLTFDKLPELEDSVRSGRLYVALLHDKLKLILVSVPDGKVCLNQEGELAVTKFAVEPVRRYFRITYDVN